MSFIIHGARRTLSVFASEFTDNIGAIFASLAIALGALIAGWLMIRLGECCTGASSSKRYDYSKEESEWKEKTSKSSRSAKRLITMTLAIMIVTAGLWVAAQTAGFNFWTVVLGYGVLALVGQQAFGFPLQNIGAFFLLSLTDKVEESYWIEFIGMGIEGRITAIHWLWVEVSYLNPTTKNVEEVQIPTMYVMSNAIRRKFAKEFGTESLVPRGPNDDATKQRVGHRLKHKAMIEV